MLERCTRELQAVEGYRNDIRYLRVWIQYVSGGSAGACHIVGQHETCCLLCLLFQTLQADCLPDPGDVFTFLKVGSGEGGGEGRLRCHAMAFNMCMPTCSFPSQEKDVGQGHALYYIAAATYLEYRGAYARADSMYQQGINKLAAPLERLRGKFQEFQQRMVRVVVFA